MNVFLFKYLLGSLCLDHPIPSFLSSYDPSSGFANPVCVFDPELIFHRTRLSTLEIRQRLLYPS